MTENIHYNFHPISNRKNVSCSRMYLLQQLNYRKQNGLQSSWNNKRSMFFVCFIYKLIALQFFQSSKSNGWYVLEFQLVYFDNGWKFRFTLKKKNEIELTKRRSVDLYIKKITQLELQTSRIVRIFILKKKL